MSRLRANEGSGEARVNNRQMNDDELRARLSQLYVAHQDLDAAVASLSKEGVPDQLRMARLKKQKLRLRDEIQWIETRLIPDIIA